MKRISLSAAAFLTSFYSLSAYATPHDEGTFRLRVLSYNVKGLPGIAGGYRNGERFREIGEELHAMRREGTAPDIVLLQEAFVKRTKDIVAYSGYPYAVKGPKAKDPDENGKRLLKIFSAGLVTMSEFPIVNAAKVAFGKGKCATWDCFANKGVQLSIVEIPDLPFRLPIFNTHLQAVAKHDQKRIEQMGVLKRFMARYMRPIDALIFAGDFNTKTHQASYKWWQENSGLYSIGEICKKEISNCEIADGTTPESLTNVDQHFALSGVAEDRLGRKARYSVRIEPGRVEKTFRKLVKGKPLSDHLGYQVDYDIRWYKML